MDTGVRILGTLRSSSSRPKCGYTRCSPLLRRGSGASGTLARIPFLLAVSGCGRNVGIAAEPSTDSYTRDAVAWWTSAGESVELGCSERVTDCVPVRMRREPFVAPRVAYTNKSWGPLRGWQSAIWVTDGVPEELLVVAVAHEIGHVLGYEHEGGLSVMRAVGKPGVNCVLDVCRWYPLAEEKEE